MSYNGSGTFLINTSGQPVVTGTVISSTAFNALTADLGTGLSTAITKDGQTATTARIPFAQGISSTLVTDSTSTTTGSIITAGGAGVAKALFVGTTANVAGTTDSSSSTTGAITTAGGVGIAKALNVGTTLAVAGNSTFAGSVNAPNTFGFKNRIINGAMVIDQRNAGATGTGNGLYVLDRWNFGSGVAGKMTYGQNRGSLTPPAGFTNYFGFITTTAYTVGASEFFLFTQEIEGYNVADLNFGTASAQTITVSFWVNSTLTGTFGGVLSNSAQNRSFPFTYTINAASTWEQKTVTVVGDTTGTWLTTNGKGLSLLFGLGVGSTFNGTATGAWQAATYLGATGATSVVGTLNATWNITGVQLEKGSTATSFDYRPYGTELALCQRYCEVFRSTTSSFSPFCSAYTITSTTGEATIQFKVEKRSSPTVTYDTASNFGLAISNTGGMAVLSAISTNRADINAITINCTSTGLVSGGGSRLFSNSTANPFIIASSEL